VLYCFRSLPLRAPDDTVSGGARGPVFGRRPVTGPDEPPPLSGGPMRPLTGGPPLGGDELAGGRMMGGRTVGELEPLPPADVAECGECGMRASGAIPRGKRASGGSGPRPPAGITGDTPPRACCFVNDVERCSVELRECMLFCRFRTRFASSESLRYTAISVRCGITTASSSRSPDALSAAAVAGRIVVCPAD